MALNNLKPLFIVLLITSTTKQNNEEEEESNPFVDAARALLQDSLQNKQDGFGTMGAVLQTFLQTDGGRQIGEMLMGGGKSLPGGGGAGAAADIISGIGSLLAGGTGNQQGGAGGGINPELISHVVDMFASGVQSNKDEDSNNNVDENNNEIKSGDDKFRKKKQDSEEGGSVDWESMLDFAASFMSSQGGPNKGSSSNSPLEGLLNLLPVLMQSVNGGHRHYDDANLENVEEHRRQEQASSFLPPFLANLYVYWDHFKDSDLGKTLWTNSGLEAIVRLFTDKDGNFQVDRIFESMENASFRRRWIRSLTSFVAEWLKHVSDPATQARYLSTVQFIGNGFLKAQGYSKAVLFDPARPAESLSLLANAVFKRQFGLKVNSSTYIKPAVAYIQEVLQLGQSKGLSLSHLSSQDIEDKLAETLNGEVIEPVLRVWRAYRFAVRVPQCDRYLVCELNKFEHGSQGPAGLKPGVTKLASLTASWFLSGHTGTPFWKLYNAAVEDHNCRVKYPADCAQFHEEDIKATTEYLHNEL